MQKKKKGGKEEHMLILETTTLNFEFRQKKPVIRALLNLMVWDLIADRLIFIIGLICYFVLSFYIKIISYPQHMNTIAFTIQWAGCPKVCSCLSSIVTTANMTMLRQDLFLKKQIN